MKPNSQLIHALDTNPDSAEPALAVGSVASGVIAIVSLIQQFWPQLLSDRNWASITQVAIIVLPLIIGVLIRNKVWSPASVNQVVKAKINQVKLDNKSALRPSTPNE